MFFDMQKILISLLTLSYYNELAMSWKKSI